MNRQHWAILAALILSSCNFTTLCLNKDSFLEGFEKFSEDVKEHHENLDESDWASIDKEFKKYVEECYPKFKEELSLGEKVDFWKHTLVYGIYRGDPDGSFSLDLDLDLDEELDELSDLGRQEIEDYFIQEIKPNIERTVDDVLNEVESLGSKIKEWLEDN